MTRGRKKRSVQPVDDCLHEKCPKSADCVYRYDSACPWVRQLKKRNGARHEWGLSEQELMEANKIRGELEQQ